MLIIIYYPFTLIYKGTTKYHLYNVKSQDQLPINIRLLRIKFYPNPIYFIF